MVGLNFAFLFQVFALVDRHPYDFFMSLHGHKQGNHPLLSICFSNGSSELLYS